MEQLNSILPKVQSNQDLTTDLTLQKRNKDLNNLKNNTVNEINALDLIGSDIKPADILTAEEMLKMNYGIDYPAEKFSMLWQIIKEEGWTDHRLKETVKWFLKNKKFPNWTISDWFDYGVKLYSYNEYLKQLHENRGLNEQIEWYKINDILCWKYIDGVELPFERIGGKK